MKNLMFGNSLMLLGLILFCMCAWEALPGVLSWATFLLVPVGFVMAVLGYIE